MAATSGRKSVSNPNTQQWLRTISRGRQSSNDRAKAAVKSNLAANGKSNLPFNSTSDYLRNLVYSANSGVPRRAISATNLRAPSSAHTRQPEDMQEELMHLKKTLVGLTNENLTLKTQMKRHESDAMKKHKEIEELLDPNQRLINVNDKGSKLAVNSMKQKLLRLEQTLKDKESMLQKLKSDLKTTRLEELRAQMDSMYQEIMRLQRTQPEPDSLNLPRELQTRMKSMNDTILRLNENNEKLQKENKLLRAKNKNTSDTDDDNDEHDDYKKMQKDDLIKVILRLEKKLSSKTTMTSKTDSKKQTLTLSEGKVKELLDEKDKLIETVKKLKNEKLKFKTVLEEKQQEIVALRREIEKLDGKSGNNGIQRQSRNKTRSPIGHNGNKSDSLDSSPEMAGQKRPSQKSPLSSPEIARKPVPARRSISGDRNKSLKTNSKLSNKSSARSVSKDRKISSTKKSASPKLSARRTEKVENFTRNRAAKTIQRQWRHYQEGKNDDDALSVIDSAAKGHLRRKNMLQKGDHSDDDSDENQHHRATNRSDSGIDDAVSMIGAAARGHTTRKNNVAKLVDNDNDQKHSSRSSDGHKSSKIGVQQNAKRANSVSNSDDDDFFSK